MDGSSGLFVYLWEVKIAQEEDQKERLQDVVDELIAQPIPPADMS